MPFRLFRSSAASRLAAIDRSTAAIEFALDGTIVSANENFLRTMGYRLDEVKGRHHSMFVVPEEKDSAEYRRFWEKLRAGTFLTAQFKRLAKGNREVWLEASYNPILDERDNPVGVLKIATDISDKHAQSLNRFEILEAIGRSQATIEFTLDGTIVSANEGFLKTMGYRLDEIKGQHHRMFVDQAYRDSAEYKRFWESLRSGTFMVGQYQRVRKDGTKVWLQATYNPILDAQGKPYKVVKVATDITRQKEEQRALAQDFETGVKMGIDQVAGSSETMRHTAQSLAVAAEQTSQQAAIVATATEQLGASVNEIARQIAQATRVTDKAVEEARRSEQMVVGLLAAADKIGAVSQLIAEIASQTNLLALNATIEAARAGDAGKGFAVVATEVKSLANQTARATQEIEQQVKAVQDSSKGTAAAIRQIVEVIAQVSEISTSVSGAVEEQAAATQEVASNISGVQRAASGTGHSANELLTLTQENAAQAMNIGSRVNTFLEKVRLI